MTRPLDRRNFLKMSALGTAGLSLVSYTRASPAARPSADPLYKISLAEWSLHRTISKGDLDPLDFAPTAKHDYGIDAVEYVNQFFKDKAKDTSYLREMKTRAEGEGVASLLIMCDGEGQLGDPDEKKRRQAAENHHKWVEAADFLGCRAIRVNAASEGSYEEQMQRAADGLRQLCTFAEDYDLDILVENHGGLSSNGEWLAGVIQAVDHPRCGTLPDFGNFCVRREDPSSYTSPCAEAYDPYQGVRELMPFAKAVSAKSHAFDERGRETTIDYPRMMQIVTGAGYHGHVGIEYEGDDLSEPEGIRATKALLEDVRAQLAASG